MKANLKLTSRSFKRTDTLLVPTSPQSSKPRIRRANAAPPGAIEQAVRACLDYPGNRQVLQVVTAKPCFRIYPLGN